MEIRGLEPLTFRSIGTLSRCVVGYQLLDPFRALPGFDFGFASHCGRAGFENFGVDEFPWPSRSGRFASSFVMAGEANVQVFGVADVEVACLEAAQDVNVNHQRRRSGGD